MDEQQDSPVVRGRCACGRRYGIRNAQAGLVVNCPNCGRPITITEADLQMAGADERFAPLQPEQAEALDAAPLEDVELRMAPKGGRTGLTGRSVLNHEEAMLSDALSGGLRMGRYRSEEPGDEATEADAEAARARSFLTELLASFCFAGRQTNMLTFLATVVACAVPWIIGMLLAGWLSSRASFVVAGVAYAYVLVVASHFFWRVLLLTARGEEEIPIFETDWDWWEDAVQPFLWMLIITAICALPALAVRRFAPAGYPYRLILIGVAAAAGSLFWPVAVMSVSIGGRLVFVRPDWLVRCLFGIGPVYLIAWLQIMVVVGAGAALLVGRSYVRSSPLLEQVVFPLCAATVTFYLGYVLFRTLGLLFRHFRRRFPWRF